MADRPGLLAAALLALLIPACLAAPLLADLLGLDPEAVDLFNRLAPPGGPNLLGTDELGRDLLLRLLEGGRVSLTVGLLGALGASLVGMAIGLAAGLAGGRTDALLMRLTDAVIALPLLPLLIVLAALDLDKLGLPEWLAGSTAASVWRIVALVTLFGWTTVARLMRSAVLGLKRREFVLAARALGAGPWRIAFWHLLPNALGPVAVATTLTVGHAILTESVLSFLGLGIQPPLPSWGNMLTGAQDLLFEAPRLALWPGALIFAAVAAVNIAGDGLRRRFDPRSGLLRH
ncbi:MAG TPA: ABC transporter permease [Geminicoccaceae bacterium]|nr:ABC transporter permease [Geminicoccus sp.]HMU50683.1 ABC transporter permease [Geminicoccaceae bacterium]